MRVWRRVSEGKCGEGVRMNREVGLYGWIMEGEREEGTHWNTIKKIFANSRLQSWQPGTSAWPAPQPPLPQS